MTSKQKELKVLVQIGRSKKGFGCLTILSVKLNGEVISWNNTEGSWATSFAERNRNLWFVAELDVVDGDVIELQSFVTTPQGVLERHTWKRIYVVDENESLIKPKDYKVGHSKFPIIQGNLREIMNVSKHDERMDEIQGLYEDLEDNLTKF